MKNNFKTLILHACLMFHHKAFVSDNETTIVSKLRTSLLKISNDSCISNINLQKPALSTSLKCIKDLFCL
ncbi:hypothetical protein O3G_MSEX006781 [Manduca sexta]|uniref:Uncharacterized protein n=1 Tax=Manduca sexta TaxID=7130 RepID=A0A921Z5H5_MANSE|nr:hypothetical protein O3G_MSEX006781 [Manduca sexta]KAG6450819.1 hypothetical protein O3G_MSEX006781 [Manduca sexta]KAG6450820.1 hypothetical protein O3G_MSEX006781 [Manduca sexta]